MITLKDISAQTGYSIATVSKALSGPSDISEETRLLIVNRANEMGYIRNEIASNLASKTSNNIVIIIKLDEGTNNIIEAQYTVAMSSSIFAKNFNYNAFTLYVGNIHSYTEEELNYFLNSKKIVGIVIFGLKKDDFSLKKLVKNNKYKKVIIDSNIVNESTSSVTIDNLSAQYEIMNVLYKKHKFQYILYFGGDSNIFVASERTKGAKKFAKDNPNVDIVFENANFCTNIALEILKKYNLSNFDAIICSTDLIAFAVKKIVILKKLDILVSGFDGLTMNLYMPYTLPTVNQSHKNMTRIAIEELDRLIKNKNTTGKYILDEYTITTS